MAVDGGGRHSTVMGGDCIALGDRPRCLQYLGEEQPVVSHSG